jgi:hypothetical protein
MAVYKTFPTEDAAKAASQSEAASRGCNGVTAYWWPWRECAAGWALIGDGVAGNGWTTTAPQWIDLTE